MGSGLAFVRQLPDYGAASRCKKSEVTAETSGCPLAQLNAAGSKGVERGMKRRQLFALTFGMVLGFAATMIGAQPSEVELMKQAKITKAEAEQIALAKVSHGVVKRAEIEKEKGHLVWSFDIARPGTRDITE